MNLIYFIHFTFNPSRLCAVVVGVAAELNNYMIAVINLKWFFNTIACKLFETCQRGGESESDAGKQTAASSYSHLIHIYSYITSQILTKLIN